MMKSISTLIGKDANKTIGIEMMKIYIEFKKNHRIALRLV